MLYTLDGGGESHVEQDTELFRDVFSASPIGIAVETLEGQPLFVNPALCSMLGFSAEEMCTKHCVQFSPPEDADKDWHLFQQLRAGLVDHYQLEKRYFRRDGSLIWGKLSISLLKGRPSPLVVAMVEDITEKKRAEEARFRHAAIVESSEDAIASATLDGVITSWNPGAERIFGYTESEVVGKPITMLVPPELSDEEDKILRKLRAGVRINQYETVRIGKTGTRIDVSLSISPIRDATGKIVGCSGIVRDITERRRSEQALRESEERLRLAAEAGRMFAYSWDAATDSIERSGESAEILGIANDQRLTGATAAAMVHPDDQPSVRAALANLTVDNPTFRITYRTIRPDGNMVWLERNSRAYFDQHGKLKRVVGMVADITERKQAEDKRKRAEEALRLSEERLRLAQEGARIGTFERNIRTGVSTWTSELELIHGLPPGGFGGKKNLWESFLHPDDRARVIDLFDQSLETRAPMQGEWRIIWPDGSVHWVAGRWRVLMNEAGEPSRMVGVNIDVTERKHAEEALSEVNRKLIEAQENERNRIGRELHDDINQRLAMLAVELERLQQDPSAVEARVQELRNDVDLISNDVQALSHDLHSSKLEYLGVVAGIKSWCKEFAERQNASIHFKSDVESVLPFEVGRPLLRILQEAVQNTIKHSGVKHIEVQLLQKSSEIQLIVSDLGRGFDVEDAMKGKGLGLTSMRERARLLNGTTTIESKPMGGTTIYVRVPLGAEYFPLSEAV